MTYSDYKRAYETAKRELAELIETQERLEKRKLALRKTIEALAAQCESENIEIEPSQEAEFLLASTPLADEIRAILKARFPQGLRPNEIKSDLERLGRDLSQYSNVQATIHMVLKRMAESGEVLEEISEGKQTYRFPPRGKVILRYKRK